MTNINAILAKLCSEGIDLGLTRMTELMDKLGNPQDALKIIHVAGTNGKGSTCAMLNSIFITSGYKTAFFSSPFLHNITELFKINNKNITKPRLLQLIEIATQAVESMESKPSEFELQTALAFLYFKEENCDIVLLEVGLGGLLDSTNIISHPVLSVITKIALDHIGFLGNTIEQIAHQKAGIIKQDCPCIALSQNQDVLDIFKQTCDIKSADFYVSQINSIKVKKNNLHGIVLDYKHIENIKIPLIGTYQIENIALVLSVIDILNQRGYNFSAQNIISGLGAVKWKGRFEILKDNPLFIIDGAHNLDGAIALTKTFDTVLQGQKFTFLMAVMSDKDYKNMIDKLIPYAKSFIAISPDIKRALPAKDLFDQISSQFDGPVFYADKISDGIEKAFEITANNPICCLGSLYISHEVSQVIANLT